MNTLYNTLYYLISQGWIRLRLYQQQWLLNDIYFWQVLCLKTTGMIYIMPTYMGIATMSKLFSSNRWWAIGFIMKRQFKVGPFYRTHLQLERLQEIVCEWYEISMSEPLHNFNNLITHILEELPHHLSGVPRDVKETITQYCKIILGKAAK